MSFIVILACLAVQWFFNMTSLAFEYQWADKYVQWMNKQFKSLEKGHGLFTVAILVLPIVIAVSLVFTIVYHTLGHIGYLILSLLLLWYYVNITSLKPLLNPLSASDLLLQSYQKIFALLFWYFVFGPVGLALYIVVETLRTQLPDQKYFVLTHGVLDWVPIRLVGLSFALAGNFSAVFKVWMKDLFQPVTDNQDQILAYAQPALVIDPDAISLVRRALIIWLVVMALVTIGSWVG